MAPCTKSAINQLNGRVCQLRMVGHGYMLRRLGLLWLMATMTLFVRMPLARAAPTADTALATATAFLSDIALPTFTDQDERFSFKPTPRQPYWRLGLGTGVFGQDSYLCVGQAGDQVIDCLAGLPAPPIPETIMPRDQAQQIALDFARRHMPELSAEGGEIRVGLEEKIAANGAYTFHLQRVEQGMRLPLQATCGVRAYDGKVVRWKVDQQAITVPLTATLTLEQAQQAINIELFALKLTPVWLDGFLEVMTLRQQQKLLWRITFECREGNAKPNEIRPIYEYYLDAADGKRLGNRQVSLDRRTYELNARVSGKQLPPWSHPDPLFSDYRPQVSPDGKRLLFTSTRARKGWPGWLPSRPSGLFIANADGTGVSCLVREGAGQPELPE